MLLVPPPIILHIIIFLSVFLIIDFETQFLTSIRDNIPFVSLFQSSAATITVNLANLLNRARFAINKASSPEVNTTQVFVDIITGIKTVIQNVQALTNEQKTCLIAEVDRNIDGAILRDLGKNLEEVRRANTIIIRIFNFLKNFNRTLGGFGVSDFPRDCISRAIDITFCGRCTKVLPPLCSNTCGALVRGCYAAFFSGFRNEFNSLWNVTRQVIGVASTGVLNIERFEILLSDRISVSCV